MKSTFLYFFASILFVLFLSDNGKGQTFMYQNSICKFKNASSFYINSTGFIFASDAGNDEIYKIDTSGNVIKDAGGYGWNQGNFDYPSGIFATSLNVYVCDKNNHRIERFDKYLNFVSQLSTQNSDNSGERFGYPLCCATSQQGDLYILDSENNRIIKFDLFGNYISNFGGYDAGAYMLSEPVKFAISDKNNLYVIDGKKIVVFDQYGNGLAIINQKENMRGVHIIFNLMTVNSDKNIYFSNLSSSDSVLKKISLLDRPKDDAIISSLIFNKKLYVLTSDKIEIFQIIK